MLLFALASAALLCSNPVVVDGDTIKCSGTGRIRMVAIDAPDLTTSSVCVRHLGDHVCDDAGEAASKAALESYVAGKRLTYRVISYDVVWRRVVGQFFAGGGDAQCHQMKVKAARYMVVYDKRYGYPLLHRCRSTVAKALR